MFWLCILIVSVAKCTILCLDVVLGLSLQLYVKRTRYLRPSKSAKKDVFRLFDNAVDYYSSNEYNNAWIKSCIKSLQEIRSPQLTSIQNVHHRRLNLVVPNL